MGNPLRRMELAAKIDIRKFKAAIILVDQSWVDPDMDATNGLQLKNQSDMLRLDSLSMAVQLNIRKQLQVMKLLLGEGTSAGAWYLFQHHLWVHLSVLLVLGIKLVLCDS